MVLTSYLALQAIDDSLIEAARSLGAPFRAILWRIVLPLSLPGLVAGAALIFVPVAGSFMEARILGGRAGTLYGTVIEDQFVAVFNWPLGAALSFVLLGRRVRHSRSRRADAPEVLTMNRPGLSQVAGRVYVGLVLVFLYAPIIVMALMSFNASEFYALPIHFTLNWYRKLAGNPRRYLHAAWTQRIDRRPDDDTRHHYRHVGCDRPVPLRVSRQALPAGDAFSADRHSLADHGHGDAAVLLLGRHRARKPGGRPWPCRACASLRDCRRQRAAADVRRPTRGGGALARRKPVASHAAR